MCWEVGSKKKPEVHSLTRNFDDNDDVVKRGTKEFAHFAPDFFQRYHSNVFTPNDVLWVLSPYFFDLKFFHRFSLVATFAFVFLKSPRPLNFKLIFVLHIFHSKVSGGRHIKKFPRPLNFKLIFVLYTFHSKTSESRHIKKFPRPRNFKLIFVLHIFRSKASNTHLERVPPSPIVLRPFIQNNF